MVHALLGLALLGTATTAPQADAWRDLVTLTCLDCHAHDDPEGDVDLETALDDPQATIELWTRAFDLVRTGAMPPESALDAEELREWTDGLTTALDIDPADPGRPTLRRLTRAHVRNVLSTLLGIEVDVERYLPRDAAGYGFDTTGDTLFVSPLYFENWYELVDDAIGQVAALPRDVLGIPEGHSDDQLRAGVEAFVSRAFRRPATAAEVDARLRLFADHRADGITSRAALLEVIRATLLSPSFFYRIEADHADASGPWPISDHELATRLSFFLWGTLPDEELLRAADDGRLARSAELQRTVDRMLADPRSRWLATDFAAQWLGFAELRDVTPDVRRFRAFNTGLRRDFRREAVAFFDDLIHADRSVIEILDSDHAFLNARLAKHYGIEGIEGGTLRRVPIEDRRRGGVLGMGAILTITSTPLRTSPVNRGQWILERLLGRPAPPPPANAGSLPEDDRQKDGLTLRERLELHRADPACAGCHARMDPYGLALETFDGIGRLRTGNETGDESKHDAPGINASVTLPDGTEVDGPAELKAALAASPGPFVETLTDALFVYAVGRPPELADRAHLQATVEAAAGDGVRFSLLVRGIVSMPAFTHRRLPLDR